MATTENLDLDGDGYHETVAGDYDGDGYLETIETDLDFDGDTDMAEVDTDLDGWTDTVIDYGTAETESAPFDSGEEWVVDGSLTADYDGDGYAETIETDLDLDGITDIAEIDTDLDGYTDTTVDLWTGEVYGTDGAFIEGCDGWTDEVYVEDVVVTEEVWVDDSTAGLDDFYSSQETYAMYSEMSESMHETNMEIIDNIDGVDDYTYETTYY